MRNFNYILLAIVLLAGCSKHTTQGDEGFEGGSYIFFEAGITVTKATENLMEDAALPVANKTSFGVFGFRADGTTPIFDTYTAGEDSPFDNVAILYRPQRGALFQYDELALWHGGNHSFYAYYIEDVLYEAKDLEDNDYTKTTDIISEIGIRQTTQNSQTVSKVYAKYNQPTDITQMADILTASVTTAPTSAPVNFVFGHMLFAMDVVIRNDQSAGKTLNVTDAKVEFQVKDTYYMYFDGTADHDPEAEDCTVEYDFIDAATTIPAPTTREPVYNLNLNHVTTQGTTRENYYTFLFPPCESLPVKFTLSFLNSWDEETTYIYGDEDSEPAISIPGGFLPGHRYQFIISRKDNNGTEIEFVPSVVESWESNDDITHTFN